jgi:hypothetical protein
LQFGFDVMLLGVHDDHHANAKRVQSVAQVVFLEVIQLISGFCRVFSNGLDELPVEE